MRIAWERGIRRARHWAGVLCIIWGVLLVSRIARGADRQDVVVREVLWQDLAGVSDVVVGPDERSWFVVPGEAAPRRSRIDLAAFKKQIEGEFARPRPQTPVAPVLFEPAGRVWFIPEPSVAVGFDGKRWVEKNLAGVVTNGRITAFGGISENHGLGELPGVGFNLAMGKWSLLVDYSGVHQLSGDGEWSHQEMLAPGGSRRRLSVFRWGPGQAIALAAREELVVWLWSEGSWKKLAEINDQERGKGGYPFPMAARWGDGVAVLGGSRTLKMVYTPEGQRHHFGKLVAELGAAAPAARERALRELETCVPEAREELEAAAASPDPEIRARARACLAAPKPPPQGACMVGGYQVSGVNAVQADAAGYGYLAARSILRGDEEKGPGALVISPEGAMQLLGADGYEALRWARFGSTALVVEKAGERVWISGVPANRDASLLDLRQLKVTQPLPERGISQILSARSDGMIFARRGPGAGTVVVYRPGLKDDREFAPPMLVSELAAPGPIAISGDGTLFAEHKATGPMRFDGEKWEALEGMVHNLRGLVPGAHGEVLGFSKEGCALWTGKEIIAATSLRQLVETHPDLILKSFAGRLGQRRTTLTDLEVDSAGNIWLNQEGMVGVFTGGKWLDVPLACPNPRLNIPVQAVLLVAAGDGSRIYVRLAEKPRVQRANETPREREPWATAGLLLGIERGKVVFEPGPPVATEGSSFPVIRQSNGLWAHVPTRRGTPFSAATIRLMMEDGAGPQVDVPNILGPFNAGLPVMLEPGGNLWVRGGIPQRPELWVFKAGYAPHKIELSAGMPLALGGERPGSAWVLTPTHLQHWVAAKPADLSTYRLEKTLGVACDPPLEHWPTVIENSASSRGFLVVAIDVILGRQEIAHRLCVQRLPQAK